VDPDIGAYIESCQRSGRTKAVIFSTHSAWRSSTLSFVNYHAKTYFRNPHRWGRGINERRERLIVKVVYLNSHLVLERKKAAEQKATWHSPVLKFTNGVQVKFDMPSLCPRTEIDHIQQSIAPLSDTPLLLLLPWLHAAVCESN